MSARFTLDLLHPGHVADSWQDWFIGPQGGRRLVIAAGIALALAVSARNARVAGASRPATAACASTTPWWPWRSWDSIWRS